MNCSLGADRIYSFTIIIIQDEWNGKFFRKQVAAFVEITVNVINEGSFLILLVRKDFFPWYLDFLEFFKEVSMVHTERCPGLLSASHFQ